MQDFPQPQSPPGVQPSMSEKDQRNWAMFVHLSSFAGLFIPLGSVIGPLVLWVLKKKESAFVDQQGKVCINFQISVAIWAIICFALSFILIGIPLLIALVILDIVYTVINALRASNGDQAKYPLSIAFLK